MGDVIDLFARDTTDTPLDLVCQANAALCFLGRALSSGDQREVSIALALMPVVEALDQARELLGGEGSGPEHGGRMH